MNRSVPSISLLEICAVSLDYAIAAQRAGANRIELCEDLACGGITPSAGLLEAAREHLQIPIQVLIRPRPRVIFVIRPTNCRSCARISKMPKT